MIKRISFIMVFFISAFSNGQNFDFNSRCNEAYQDILALRFTDGKNLLEQEKKENPSNLIPYFVENYIDFLKTYINEDEAEYKLLEKNRDVRLDKLKTGDKSSPYYLYTQAELQLQWAFSRLKYGQYIDAFSGVKKTYSLLEENEKKFPSFIADKKSMGMLHAIVGAIPENYKWGTNLIGMDGTIDEGLEEIASIIRYADTHEYIFKQEAYLYYAFLSLYLKKDDVTAWNIVKDLDTKNNLLNCFCVASIAMRTGRNNTALSVLINRPATSAYFNFSYFNFMLGLVKTRKLEPDAPVYLKKFVAEFKGKTYIKEAYQKLAWNALLNNDMAGYHSYMELAKTKGTDVIDDDKQALEEAESGVAPNITLLKARLLFDGGYYKQALQQLEGKKVDDFSSQKEKVEFTYRAGRIYHAGGYPEQAKGYYVATIQNGAELSNYYAASACIQLGQIYEKAANYDKAEYYYDKCFDMKNDEYKSTLESEAKAGLQRVKGK